MIWFISKTIVNNLSSNISYFGIDKVIRKPYDISLEYFRVSTKCSREVYDINHNSDHKYQIYIF